MAGAGISPRRATHFLLLRQKKVSKEKAIPLSASPALRSGATCGARVQRGLARTRFAQTIASPDPLAAALLGAFRGVGEPSSHSGLCCARPWGRQLALSVAWAFSTHIVRFATKSFWLNEQLSSENSALDSSRSSKFSSTSL